MASLRSGPLRAFRIADMRHSIFDGSGAMLHGARWNSPGRRVIYAAETYAGALLEILVHASGSVARSQGYVEIEIPSGLSIEEITQDDVPRWMHHPLKPPKPSVIDGTTSAAHRY